MTLVLDAYERKPPIDRASALLGAIDELVLEGSEWKPERKEKRVKWLYDILTILDNKTAHLLRLNSMLLAAQSFLVGTLEVSDLPFGVRCLLVVLLLVPFAGIYYALKVFGIAWPFLPWRLGITDVSSSFEDECRDLATICAERTIQHANVRRSTAVAVSGAFLMLLIVGGILLAAPGGN